MNIDWTPVKSSLTRRSTETGGTARLPHPTSQFRYQTLPSAMRASLIEGFFVLSSPYHSSGPTPSTGSPSGSDISQLAVARAPFPHIVNDILRSLRPQSSWG
ncbi:hypothetical protein J6590_009593 [Homalodisca vitripennis]|nr:hypothetical protein J6590_009593 [Homalodisca vitripennis]